MTPTTYHFRKMAFLALMFFPAVHYAQDNGSICTALLEHGLSNVVDYSSEYDYLTVVKDNYCGASYASMSKSRQDSFTVAIKKIPLGYRGGSNKSSEQYDYFCREYGHLQSTSTQSRYSASTLYDLAIEAWRDCINLALGGTQIKPSVTPDEKIVDFAMSVSKGNAVFTGVETTHMSCTMDGRKIGPKELVELSSVVQSVRCVREHVPLDFNSASVQFFPQADVKVKASTGDYRVDLYEMIDGPANDRISRLEAEIAALRAEANSTTSKFAGMGMEREGTSNQVTNPKMGSKKANCPEGAFVSAISATKGVGGKYAVDGISELTVICSPIMEE